MPASSDASVSAREPPSTLHPAQPHPPPRAHRRHPRYYRAYKDNRDSNGHGTHVTGTLAGMPVGATLADAGSASYVGMVPDAKLAFIGGWGGAGGEFQGAPPACNPGSARKQPRRAALTQDVHPPCDAPLRPCPLPDLGADGSDSIETPSDIVEGYFKYTASVDAWIHSGTCRPVCTC